MTTIWCAMFAGDYPIAPSLQYLQVMERLCTHGTFTPKHAPDCTPWEKRRSMQHSANPYWMREELYREIVGFTKYYQVVRQPFHMEQVRVVPHDVWESHWADKGARPVLTTPG